MGILLLTLQLKRACQGRQEWSDLAKEGRFEAPNTPESQTLIVLSQDPDTIVLPSGEKATEATVLLCALVFSLFSSSVAAWEGGASQI